MKSAPSAPYVACFAAIVLASVVVRLLLPPDLQKQALVGGAVLACATAGWGLFTVCKKHRQSIQPLDVALFAATLVVYAIYIGWSAIPMTVHDEPTYLLYASNLSQGRYAPEGTGFLWAGPGYPAVLGFTRALGTPLGIPEWTAKFANALFLAGAVFLTWKMTPQSRSVPVKVLVFAAIALYVPFWEMLPFRMSEPFTILLIAAIAFAAKRAFTTPARGWSSYLLLGALLGYMSLTKIVFGYVMAASLALFFAVWLVRRQTSWLNFCKPLLLGLVFCLPYLAYTYGQTNTLFCWGTSGGMQLYWMSNPNEREYGDWSSFQKEPSESAADNALFRKRHEPVLTEALGNIRFYEKEPYPQRIARLGPRQDQILRQKAIENITANPLKYLDNLGANISRMLMDTPYSYKPWQPDWRFALPNLVLLALALAGLARHGIRSALAKPWLAFLLVITTIYLAGSCVVSAYPRQFYVIAPVLLIVALGLPTRYREVAAQRA